MFYFQFQIYVGQMALLKNENHDINSAMFPSHADPILPWLGVIKFLYQSHCTNWGHLNAYISIIQPYAFLNLKSPLSLAAEEAAMIYFTPC